MPVSYSSRSCLIAEVKSCLKEINAPAVIRDNTVLVLFFSLCRQIYAVLYMCIMYTFKRNCIYFVHVMINDCKFIKKYMQLIPVQRYFYYQLSTEQLSTKLNSLRMTSNLGDFYISQLNAILDLTEISTRMIFNLSELSTG